MKIAVLAVQGAFAEHRKKIEDLGIECMELRKKEEDVYKRQKQERYLRRYRSFMMCL